MINDSHLIGYVVGIVFTIVSAHAIPTRKKKKNTRFKKGDARTTLLARLGGYTRWDRDGKVYKKKKKTKKSK